MNPEDLSDLIEAQLAAHGVSCLSANDGHVFTFTIEVLQKLLERAKESGRITVFVQKGIQS